MSSGDIKDTSYISSSMAVTPTCSSPPPPITSSSSPTPATTPSDTPNKHNKTHPDYVQTLTVTGNLKLLNC